jgi:glycolate oxidase FAD binding subunit
MAKTDQLISTLKGIVGEANLIKNPDQIKLYSLNGKRPKVVVFPGTIDEVSKIVSYAHEERVTIIPRGNGTKLEMGGIPKKADLILSTGRLNRITDCDCDNLTLSVESGITLNEVQKRLAKEGRGYFLPLDPFYTNKATLGGIVATNSTGPRRLLYGAARDMIIGIKAVFPNGDIVLSGGKTVKNVSGYDMCKLLIGSFGTLGILYEMTFKLLPLPEKEATLLIPFTSLDEVNGFIHEIIHSQFIPASIETLNAVVIKKMKFSIPMPPDANYLVAIGLEGVSEGIERQISELRAMGKKYGALGEMQLHSEKHQDFWIALRDFPRDLKGNYPNLISLKSNFLISKWGEMLKSYEKIVQESGFDHAFLCHSGNGILYSHILSEKNLRSKIGSLIELIEKLKSEAVKNEGNLVVESSPLSMKKKVDVWGQSRSDYEIMHRLKEQIDPVGILNPGRFVGGI